MVIFYLFAERGVDNQPPLGLYLAVELLHEGCHFVELAGEEYAVFFLAGADGQEDAVGIVDVVVVEQR